MRPISLGAEAREKAKQRQPDAVGTKAVAHEQFLEKE